EIIRLGLLPLSLEEEKALEKKRKRVCTSKVFGMPKNLLIEIYTGGFLYAFLILAGLLSRTSSFVNACSWNLLCFSGKISFSIYLLHPIGLTIVNNYATTIGVQGAARETEDDEKVNDILDAVMLSVVVTIAISWCFNKAIERPIMNFTNYITKTKFFEYKKNHKRSDLHIA
ncbi:8436_t:CDS:2, partial [Dentiscutata erythropus]